MIRTGYAPMTESVSQAYSSADEIQQRIEAIKKKSSEMARAEVDLLTRGLKLVGGDPSKAQSKADSAKSKINSIIKKMVVADKDYKSARKLLLKAKRDQKLESELDVEGPIRNDYEAANNKFNALYHELWTVYDGELAPALAILGKFKYSNSGMGYGSANCIDKEWNPTELFKAAGLKGLNKLVGREVGYK